MNGIDLRPAVVDDCDLLFEWANEEETRRFSLSPDIIPIETHKEWFSGKLNSPGLCRIFIAEIGGSPVGQIRFDKNDNDAVISYGVDKDWRGKGFGKLLVEEGVKCIKEKWTDIAVIKGIVKRENVASQKIFDQLSFSKHSTDDTIEYRLNL